MAGTKDTRGYVGTMPPGWWEAHVPPDANPVEVVEIVERVTDGAHPALPELRQIARAYQAAKAAVAPESLYRCPICRDQGMQEIVAGEHDVGSDRMVKVLASSARPVYRKCRGVAGTGCRYRVWRIEETVKKGHAGAWEPGSEGGRI